MKWFDAWIGAHQKIDRLARRNLKLILSDQSFTFPTSRELMAFEGRNGPDGIKRKSPSRDEPWHFYNPNDPTDERIIGTIEQHMDELTRALREKNKVRAAFEASWLAHAIVDGLTPAHHYPYEDELMKLRGQGKETRSTWQKQVIIPGETLTRLIRNNWKMWGDKGLAATHFAFEWGICAIILPLRYKRSVPSEAEIDTLLKDGFSSMFRQQARQIASLRMYETFYMSGWTPSLAKQARRELIPRILNAVTLAWYTCILDSRTAP